MPRDGELHLIDPFGKQPGALPRDWAGTEWATRRTVARAARGGPKVVWHAQFSQDAPSAGARPIDLLFIDGDHLEPGVRRDWDDWHDHVVPGGHVAFHDSRESKRTAAVSRGRPRWSTRSSATARRPAGRSRTRSTARRSSAATAERCHERSSSTHPDECAPSVLERHAPEREPALELGLEGQLVAELRLDLELALGVALLLARAGTKGTRTRA
jgi:hypothetical protein